MTATLKPANEKARALMRKLQALAERGIDGERLSAQRKIARLKSRFDFGVPDPAETPDLFTGRFTRSRKAKGIYVFKPHEFDLANSVKWAIESATGITCLHRDGELVAEASPPTARKLTNIAAHIANSFRVLLERFEAFEGVTADDRCAFVMGLYDGMMNEVRKVGQRLPTRYAPKPHRGRKKAAHSNPVRPAKHQAGLHVHPYTVALGLGKQIRFSASLEEITAELDAVKEKLAIGGGG